MPSHRKHCTVGKTGGHADIREAVQRFYMFDMAHVASNLLVKTKSAWLRQKQRAERWPSHLRVVILIVYHSKVPMKSQTMENFQIFRIFR